MTGAEPGTPRAWRSAIRASAFLRKEIVEVVRQPRLLVVLVLGPFLVLLVFGGGLREEDPAVRTKFVVDPGSPIAEQIERFAAAQDERLRVVAVTADRATALRELREGTLDLVVVVPDDAVETIRTDEPAAVTAYHDQLDPIESQAIELFTRTAVDEINQLVLRRLVAESQRGVGEISERLDVARRSVARLEASATPQELAAAQSDLRALAAVVGPTAALLDELGEGDRLIAALSGISDAAAQLETFGTEPDTDQIARIERDLALLDRGLTDFEELSPATVAAPFEGVARQIVETPVALSDYYAPAVVALLLQHLVVTFVSLSLVRERTLGATELFRVAPMTVLETLLGKYVAYLLLGGGLALVLFGALVVGLGVPFAGPLPGVAAVTLLVLAASIGLGFVFALLADSDSQAVQYAMLLLLASIFFTGFLLSLDRFRQWVAVVAWPIPAAEGVQALRDLMLRGTPLGGDALRHLLLLTVVYFAAAWALLVVRQRRG